MLITDYYTIKNVKQEEDRTIYDISLNPACSVYAGHFPGEPVAPGVCNIQMIKECAELIVGKPLFLGYIQSCRLTTLMSPEEHPEVEVCVQLLSSVETGIKIRATIGKREDVYLDMKAELSYRIV